MANEGSAVRLQWVGLVRSKAASEFAVGECMAWNGGYVTEILAIREASPAYLLFTFESSNGDGSRHDRRIKKSTQCAIGAKRAPRAPRTP